MSYEAKHDVSLAAATKVRIAVVAVLAAQAMSCLPSPEKLEGLVPEDERSAARAVLEDIRTGDVAAIEAALHSEVSASQAREALAPTLAKIAASDSFTPRFGSWRWVSKNSVTQHEIVYEVAAGADLFLVSMVFKDESGSPRIAGIHFQPLASSLIESNRFTLEGKRAVHYSFLTAGIAIPVFCLVTAVVCWRRRPRRRWLWILFILVGFPVFVLDWTTGVLSLRVFAFNLLGAAFEQQGAIQPMYLQLGVPIGALVFWIRAPDRRA